MPSITKQNLSQRIAEHLNLHANLVQSIIDDLILEMGNELSRGKPITLRTFGSFDVRKAKAKVGRNPKKVDSEIFIPARCVVKFRPSIDLKERVAQLQTHKIKKKYVRKALE
jgi:nucleoid DNA-binding protein